MKQDLLDNIKIKVENYSLSEKDKLDILSVFSKFPDAETEVLLELINEDEKVIELLNDNFKLKKETPAENKEAWKKIFQKEEEVLSLIE